MYVSFHQSSCTHQCGNSQPYASANAVRRLLQPAGLRAGGHARLRGGLRRLHEEGRRLVHALLQRLLAGQHGFVQLALLRVQRVRVDRGAHLPHDRLRANALKAVPLEVQQVRIGTAGLRLRRHPVDRLDERNAVLLVGKHEIPGRVLRLARRAAHRIHADLVGAHRAPAVVGERQHLRQVQVGVHALERGQQRRDEAQHVLLAHLFIDGHEHPLLPLHARLVAGVHVRARALAHAQIVQHALPVQVLHAGVIVATGLVDPALELISRCRPARPRAG